MPKSNQYMNYLVRWAVSYFFFTKDKGIYFLVKILLFFLFTFFLSFSMTNSLVSMLFYVHSWENVLLFNVIKVRKMNFCINTLQWKSTQLSVCCWLPLKNFWCCYPCFWYNMLYEGSIWIQFMYRICIFVRKGFIIVL